MPNLKQEEIVAIFLAEEYYKGFFEVAKRGISLTEKDIENLAIEKMEEWLPKARCLLERLDKYVII